MQVCGFESHLIHTFMPCLIGFASIYCMKLSLPLYAIMPSSILCSFPGLVVISKCLLHSFEHWLNLCQFVIIWITSLSFCALSDMCKHSINCGNLFIVNVFLMPLFPINSFLSQYKSYLVANTVYP